MLKTLTLITIGSLILASCKHKNEVLQETPIPVIAYEVKTSQQNEQLSLSATTEAEYNVNLGFMVAGKISHIYFTEGQFVRKGQLIAAIDDYDYNLGLTAANADLNKANDEYSRLKIMYDRGSLTPSDYQSAIKAKEQAQAQQKSQLKKVSDTRLYAPVSGLLATRSVEPGMVVGQGSPVFLLVDIQPIKVSASLPENELGQISIGSPANVRISALDTTYAGTIVEIGAIADQTTRAYTVKINLPNADQKIRPGMVAEVSLPAKRKTKVLTVPTEAILHDAAEATFVYVIDKVKNKAFKRKVTIGNLFDSGVQVTSGLNPGELIVAGGQQKLTDGVTIKIGE